MLDQIFSCMAIAMGRVLAKKRLYAGALFLVLLSGQPQAEPEQPTAAVQSQPALEQRTAETQAQAVPQQPAAETQAQAVPQQPAAPAVAYMKPDSWDVSVNVGGALTLRYSVHDAAGNDLPSDAVTWSLSDKRDQSVATVSESGLIRGIGTGTAYVIAIPTGSSRDKVGAVSITVGPSAATMGPADYVKLEQEIITIDVGEEVQLNYSVYDAAGNTLTLAGAGSCAGHDPGRTDIFGKKMGAGNNHCESQDRHSPACAGAAGSLYRSSPEYCRNGCGR